MSSKPDATAASSPARASCLYAGAVRHRRTTPVPHEFRYSLFMVYLDLDELDTVFRSRWLWSTRRAAPARFDRRDHMGDPDQPLADEVRSLVERRTTLHLQREDIATLLQLCRRQAHRQIGIGL